MGHSNVVPSKKKLAGHAWQCFQSNGRGERGERAWERRFKNKCAEIFPLLGLALSHQRQGFLRYFPLLYLCRTNYNVKQSRKFGRVSRRTMVMNKNHDTSANINNNNMQISRIIQKRSGSPNNMQKRCTKETKLDILFCFIFYFFFSLCPSERRALLTLAPLVLPWTNWNGLERKIAWME